MRPNPVPARRRAAGSVFLFCLMAGLSVTPWELRANPTGGTVAAGSATMGTNGNVLTVNNSNGTIINWQAFSIAAGETTKFLQPNAASTVLNRVTGTDLSAIYGTLFSNGHVILLNPNGIAVGPGGMINTAGFIGSTLALNDDDFLKGNLHFQDAGGTGTIQNLGTVQARSGDVYLISRHVDNEGAIRAAQGTAGLYASDEVYLATGQAGEGAVRVSASSFAGGTGIQNGGLIEAAQAELKATGNMYALAINNSGAVRATGTVVKNGVVRFVATGGTVQNGGTIQARNADGSGGSVKLQTGAGGTTLSSGLVDVSGRTAGKKGGYAELTGDHVGLTDGAVVDASGPAGGGTILVGGDAHGSNPDVYDASATYVGQDVRLDADATDKGDGGKVVVWGNDITRFYGAITAKGGPNGGNGGWVETSGHSLEALGRVDASAARGHGGSWLLDPDDLTISDTAPDSNLDTATSGLFGTLGGGSTLSLGSLLDALENGATDDGGVTIELDASGNIATSFSTAVTSNLSIAHDDTLTLRAGNNITLSDWTLNASGAKLNLNLLAGDTGLNGSPVSANVVLNDAHFDTNGGSVNLYSTAAASSLATFTGSISLTNSTISTSGGNIFMGGDIADDPSSFLFSGSGDGISLSGSTLDAGAGNITLQAGTNVASAAGIRIQSSTVRVTDGTVVIDGLGSNANAGSPLYGAVLDGATVEATGAGNVTLQGNIDGGAGGSAVWLENGAVASVAGGVLTVDATAVLTSGDHGLTLQDASSQLRVGNGGTLSFILDDLQFSAGSIVHSAGSGTLEIASRGGGIYIGSGAGGHPLITPSLTLDPSLLGGWANVSLGGADFGGDIEVDLTSALALGGFTALTKGLIRMYDGSIVASGAGIDLEGGTGLFLSGVSLQGTGAADVTLAGGATTLGYSIQVISGAAASVENGTLTVRAEAGNNPSRLAIQNETGTTFSATGTGAIDVIADSLDMGGGTPFSGSSHATLSFSNWSGGTFNMYSVAATGFASVEIASNGDLEIDPGTTLSFGSSSVTLQAAYDIYDQGTIVTQGGDVSLLSGGSGPGIIEMLGGDGIVPAILTHGGSIVLAGAGTSGMAEGVNQSAVYLYDATLDATVDGGAGTVNGGGAIVIRGHSGIGEMLDPSGVDIEGGSILRTGGGQGIAINGSVTLSDNPFGELPDGNAGVTISQSVIGNDGVDGGFYSSAISIVGSVGTAAQSLASSNNSGVFIDDGAEVNAGGGSLTLTGNVWASGNGENGVSLGASSPVYLSANKISITGATWRPGSSAPGDGTGSGIFFNYQGTSVIAGTGGMTIDGTTQWAGNPSYGVQFNDGVVLWDDGGIFKLKGTAAGYDGFSTGDLGFLNGNASPGLYVSHGGSLQVTADNMVTANFADSNPALFHGDNNSSSFYNPDNQDVPLVTGPDSAVSFTWTMRSSGRSVLVGQGAQDLGLSGFLAMENDEGFGLETVNATGGTIYVDPRNNEGDDGLNNSVTLNAGSIQVLNGFQIQSGARVALTLNATGDISYRDAGDYGFIDAAADSTLKMTAGGTLTLDGGLHMAGHAVLNAQQIILGAHSDFSVGGGSDSYAVLEVGNSFVNQGGSSAIRSSNGGRYVLVVPNKDSASLNGLTPVTGTGTFSLASLPRQDTIYYLQGTLASLLPTLGIPNTDKPGPIINSYANSRTAQLPPPSPGNHASDDIVSGNDDSGSGGTSKGDGGPGNGSKSKIQSQTVASNNSAPAPGTEQVVGAGAVGAIGAGVHAGVNIPPPPALTTALTPVVRSQLAQALQP